MNELNSAFFLESLKQDNESLDISIESFESLYWEIRNNPSKNFYKKFKISKKNGGFRKIKSPNPSLGKLQKSIVNVLQKTLVVHKSATGYVKGKSIVNNARLHTRRKYVFNIDLKDFFDNISIDLINDCLYKNYFYQYKNGKDISTKISWILTDWNNFNIRSLPQGSPSSPFISNISLYNLDEEIHQLSKKYNLVYSRYVDDMTFSSNMNKYNDESIFENGSVFIKKLTKVLRSYNLRINPEKIRLQRANESQIVTGLRVNKKVNVSQKFKKNLRHNLFLWEKYGYDKANEIFKQLPQNKNKELINVIHGNLAYLKLVRGWFDPVYLKYRDRFKTLNKFSNINIFDQNNSNNKKFKEFNKTKIAPLSVEEFIEAFPDIFED